MRKNRNPLRNSCTRRNFGKADRSLSVTYTLFPRERAREGVEELLENARVSSRCKIRPRGIVKKLRRARERESVKAFSKKSRG